MSIFCKMGQRQIYDVCRYPNIYYRTKKNTHANCMSCSMVTR